MNQLLNIAIYVVNHDRASREAIGRIFRSNRISNYTIYSSKEELLESLHRGVRICIIECCSGSTGAEALELMKNIHGLNGECKCIIMSDCADPYLVAQFTNSGAFRIVLKEDDTFPQRLVHYINEAISIILYSNKVCRVFLKLATDSRQALTSLLNVCADGEQPNIGTG